MMTRLGILLLLLTLLPACVSSTRMPGSQVDREKALALSNDLARSYIAKRNWDAAKRHLAVALDLDRNSPDSHQLMALVLQNTGEIELAEKHFRKALGPRYRRRPGKPQTIGGDEAQIHNNYGVFLYQEGRYEEATRQFELAVSDLLYERRFAAFLNLGRSYLKLSRNAEAAEAFRRAWLLEKRNPLALIELADVHFVLGNYAKAMEYYRSYTAVEPKPTARSLWLGIRLAYQFRDENTVQNKGLTLKGMFPNSPEYLEYLRFTSGRRQ